MGTLHHKDFFHSNVHRDLKSSIFVLGRVILFFICTRVLSCLCSSTWGHQERCEWRM